MLTRQGELDGEGLKAAQALFKADPNAKRKFMQLQLDQDARAGQSDNINQACAQTKSHSRMPS